MGASLPINLRCDYTGKLGSGSYAQCPTTTTLNAVVDGKNIEKLRLDLSHKPEGWTVEIDTGSGYGSPSRELRCYCPEHDPFPPIVAPSPKKRSTPGK